MTVKEFFDNLNGGARWDVGVSINRSNSLPLDANSVFASLEAAQNYAAGNPAEGTLANAYPGQVLAVVTDTETVIYYIDANMALQPVGNTKEVMAYIGEIPEGSDATTIIEYINAKTSGIATDAALAELQAAVNNKVDKVDGKGLSTNDLTDELKVNYDAAYDHSQVAHAPADAQANVIESIKVNGTAQSITDKSVDITVPTKVTDLTNDAGYLTEHQDISGKADKATTLAGYGITDAYTTDEVDTAVQGAKDYAKDLVDNLPELPEQIDYTVTITETTDGLENNVAKKYTFTQNGTEIGSINLAKELVVTSGSVKAVTEAGVPYEGAVVGDKYIELVIANQDTPIYVPAKDLVDIYTPASGATEVQVAISANNEISATLVDGGVTENKLADDVKAKLNKTWEEVGVAKSLVDALADGAVKANADAIKAINDETTGVLAVAKGYADGLNNAMNGRVEALEAIDHEHANKSLLDTYTQTETDLADAVSKKHAHENATILDAINADKVAAWDAAEKNVIASVDQNQFAVDSNRNLTLLDVAQEKISGLTNAAGSAITLADALNAKVDKVEGSRLINADEIAKLAGLVVDPETGETSLPISGQIAMSQVDGLASALDTKVDKVEGMGLSANNFTDTLLAKVNGIEEGAQVNVIEQIKFNGNVVTVGEDKVADITYALPIADSDTLGGVKSVDAILDGEGKVTNATAIENKVAIAEDGTMEVNTLNINKLVQTASEYIILNGGSSSSLV